MVYGYITDEDGCYTWEEAFVDGVSGAVIGAISAPYLRGAEYPFLGGKVAPFGNKWFYPSRGRGWWPRNFNRSNGKWPHYHVRRPGRGQGIGRHRPYDKSPFDNSFWDRF